MGYDLERSVNDAPVFNSENHVIADRETRYVPGSHLRAALWQGAVHGLGASTIWVWERSFDPKSDTYGSIMHRPACAEAAGLVNCDLNRASEEMTAIQQAPAKALVLQSVTASVWDKGAYGDSMDKAYTALSFTGLKPGFVTERQLEEGIVPDAPLIFVPNIRHLSDAAFAGLKRYRGKIVYVGKDLLSFDDYGRPRTETLPSDTIDYRYGPTQWKDLWAAILSRLPDWGAKPEVGLADDQGAAIWGVDWKTADTEKGILVNLCNLRQTPEKVRLVLDGKTPGATDVLTGETVTGLFTLQPLEVKLLRLSKER
jgi:hypothetical protein